MIILSYVATSNLILNTAYNVYIFQDYDLIYIVLSVVNYLDD